MNVLPGSDFNRLPDYPQVATVHCFNCGDSVCRPMQTIVKMLDVDGVVTCSEPCRKRVEQELFETMFYFAGAIS